MNNLKYFLGVDGGGSKTTAAVFSSDGQYICSACGESINYRSVGMKNARSAMAEIIGQLSVKEFDCAVIGSSALNGRATEEETKSFCDGIIKSKKIIMDSDLYIALEAADAEGECAAVISGTGSMTVMRNSEGKISTAGGWGYILGDEGSGYSIGLCGIKAAIRGFEDSTSETALTQKCLQYFGITNIYDLIDLYYNTSVSRKITAAFTKEVMLCAESGDKTAKDIVENEAKSLSKTVLSLLKDAKEDITIGLWGGVFQHNPIFTEKFINLLRKSGFCNVKLLSFTPELGAIVSCFREEGFQSLDIPKDRIIQEYSQVTSKA